MLAKLRREQQLFESLIRNSDYTFIGPADDILLGRFIEAARRLAPGVILQSSVHEVLSQTTIIDKAIKFLPNNTSMKIYVVERADLVSSPFMSIEKYCRKHDIPLPTEFS